VKKEKSKVIEVNAQGSLGILALGHLGLRAWRYAVEKEKIKTQKPKK
jgi:hypothetical protein